MSFKATMWLSFVLFTFHNIEEYFTVPAFMESELSRLPTFATRFVKPVSADAFLLMLILVSINAIVAVYVCTVSRPHSPGMLVGMCIATGALFINGVHHLGASLIFMGYTPGVITSALLLIPYSIYLCRKAIVEDLTSLGVVISSGAVSTILMAPLIFLSRFIANLILS